MVQELEKIYGLIGYPLGHSFSQDFFNMKFMSEGIKAQYINFEIPNIEDFPSLVEDNPIICGMNVTIPYKEKVMAYLDELDPIAEAIGAVNVIKISRNSKGKPILKGYNSDIIGFVDSIKSMLKPWHNKALVLGTGGAAKAVCQGLLSLCVEPQLVSRFPGEGKLAYVQLTREIMESHKIVVNTTPLGMYPKVDDYPPIPYQFLTPEHICYDLLYNPDVTMFMRKSQEQGAEVKNGLEMLLMQAFAAWNIWNSPKF